MHSQMKDPSDGLNSPMMEWWQISISRRSFVSPRGTNPRRVLARPLAATPHFPTTPLNPLGPGGIASQPLYGIADRHSIFSSRSLYRFLFFHLFLCASLFESLP